MEPKDMRGRKPTYDPPDMIGFAVWFRDMDPVWDTELNVWFVALDMWDTDVDLEPSTHKGYTGDELLREYLRTTL